MASMIPGVEFHPTHRVPAAGLATYPTPDPAATRGPSLESGLDVQVLEQRPDGWARIGCSNGWTTWGDGRLLSSLPRFVPGGGLTTFAAPEADQQLSVSLDPGLEISVMEHHHDGWAEVACSNGWRTWVDGRMLVNHPAAAPTAAAAPIPSVPRPADGAPGSAAPSTTVVTATGDSLYLTWLPLAAGTLVLVGAFIPWFRTPGGGISAWRVTLWFLFGRAKTNPQPHIGPVLLVPAALILAYALVPLASARVVSRRVLFAGTLLAVDLALCYFGRWLHPATGIGLDIGPVVVLAGGILAAVSHWRTRPAGGKGRWGWL
jgi:hypothetical protein